jgi:hypothetical protein
MLPSALLVASCLRPVHVEVRGRRVLQSCYRPSLARGLALQRSHPDAVCSIHAGFLQAAWACVLS